MCGYASRIVFLYREEGLVVIGEGEFVSRGEFVSQERLLPKGNRAFST